MINALKYTENLEEAGFTSNQAKTSIKIWLEIMESNFATKNDLKELEFNLRQFMNEQHSEMKLADSSIRSEIKLLDNSLRSEMKEMESSIHSDIRELESRLTIKLGSLMAIGLGLIAVLNKL